jgi:hypothetical protein
LLLASAAGTARAAIISDVITFSTAGQSGSLTLTLDASQNYGDRTIGIALNSLSLTLGSALAFNYSSSFGSLNIGRIQGGVNSVQNASDDFALGIINFPSLPAFGVFAYHQITGNASGSTVDGTITVAPESTPTPEPDSITLSLVGLAGVI